jgi:hypothetical protein
MPTTEHNLFSCVPPKTHKKRLCAVFGIIKSVYCKRKHRKCIKLSLFNYISVHPSSFQNTKQLPALS